MSGAPACAKGGGRKFTRASVLSTHEPLLRSVRECKFNCSKFP